MGHILGEFIKALLWLGWAMSAFMIVALAVRSRVYRRRRRW